MSFVREQALAAESEWLVERAQLAPPPFDKEWLSYGLKKSKMIHSPTEPPKTPAEKEAHYELLDEPYIDEYGAGHVGVRIHKLMSYGFPTRDCVRAIERAERISLSINSIGGDVDSGIALYRALAGKPVTVTVFSKCWSAAVLPLCAGQERKIASDGSLMIHEPHAPRFGTASQLLDASIWLEETREFMAEILCRHCPADLVQTWLGGGDHYLTPAKALECGLITEIIES